MPAGATVAGDLAPALAMRTTSVALFSAFGIGAWDLYVQQGVRWVVAKKGEGPAWGNQHPAARAVWRLDLSTTQGPYAVGPYELP